MYLKLMHEWFQSEEYKKREFPRIHPGDEELFAMIDFCSWLDRKAVEHKLAVDDGQAVVNNVREAIKEARHWMLESEEPPRFEIKREVVITYLNMIERSLETPIATKA